MALNYTIQSGDTLSQIALDLGVDMRELAEANQIEDANKIRAGKKLVIPAKAEKQQEAKEIQQIERSIQQAKKPTPLKRKDKPQPVAVERNILDKAKDFFISSASASTERPSLLTEKKPVPKKVDEPLLSANVRQFLYDIAGVENTVTEKDLKSEERAALIEVVKAVKNKNTTKIDYEDYDTTGKANAYADIGGTYATNEDNIAFISKITNPAYSLKTLLGAANIVEDEDGNTLVIDRYNFNDARDFDALDFAKGVAEAGKSGYKQLRNIGKFFGSKEGEGSPVVINLGKLKV